MKELTFREVIANIKEGEVWEGENKIIKCSEIAITIEVKDDGVYNAFGFLDESLYKLKRSQYTFQEAFKSFEEGKEIESCESSVKYKGDEDGFIRIVNSANERWLRDKDDDNFTIREIQGKWYIND